MATEPTIESLIDLARYVTTNHDNVPEVVEVMRDRFVDSTAGVDADTLSLVAHAALLLDKWTLADYGF